MYSIREGTEVLQHIDDAHDALITAVAGLSDAQSRFKPAPEAWSVAGIVEHLAIVEDRIVNRIHELLASAPEMDKPIATKEADEILKHKVLDRSAKAQAPEATHPTGKSIAESLDSLCRKPEQDQRNPAVGASRFPPTLNASSEVRPDGLPSVAGDTRWTLHAPHATDHRNEDGVRLPAPITISKYEETTKSTKAQKGTKHYVPSVLLVVSSFLTRQRF